MVRRSLRVTCSNYYCIREEYDDTKHVDEDGIDWSNEPGYASELSDDWMWEREFGTCMKFTILNRDPDHGDWTVNLNLQNEQEYIDFGRFFEDYGRDEITASSRLSETTPDMHFEFDDYDQEALVECLNKQGWHLSLITRPEWNWFDLYFYKDFD